MADDAFPIGEFDKLLATLLEEIDSKNLSAYIVALLKKWLDEGRAEILAKIQSGTLTGADWPKIRLIYKTLVRVYKSARAMLAVTRATRMASIRRATDAKTGDAHAGLVGILCGAGRTGTQDSGARRF